MVHEEEANTDEVEDQVNAITNANSFVECLTKCGDRVCFVTNFAKIFGLCEPRLAHLTLTLILKNRRKMRKQTEILFRIFNLLINFVKPHFVLFFELLHES